MRTLVLGGTSGLGKEIAAACTARGDETLVVGRSSEYWRFDLSDYDQGLTLAHAVPHVDNFFWVAGIWLKKDNFSEQGLAEIIQLIDVNFRNALPVVHQIWKGMASAQSRKSFAVIASTSGIVPRAQEAIYAASKFAQVGLTRSLAAENRNSEVKVSLFLPGGMKTGLFGDNPPPSELFDTFNDPKKVASKIVDTVEKQTAAFHEEQILRGTLQ